MSFLAFSLVGCSKSDVDKLAETYVNNSDGQLGKPVATCVAKAILNSDRLSDETKKLLIAGEKPPKDDQMTIAGIAMRQMGNADC